MMHRLLFLTLMSFLLFTPKAAQADAVVYPDGSIRFPAISLTIPNIEIQQGDFCDIVLQAGEHINQDIISDSIRWKMTDGVSGTDTPHIFVKPVFANLHALLTITTNRRAYHLHLISVNGAGREFVGFYYPKPINEIRQELARREAYRRAYLPQPAWTCSSPLDTRYAISGARQFRPKSVCNDGTRTYINMGHVSGSLPILVSVADGKIDQIIGNPTWQPAHNEYTIDGVPTRLALLRDSRHGQLRVEIWRSRK